MAVLSMHTYVLYICNIVVNEIFYGINRKLSYHLMRAKPYAIHSVLISYHAL